MTDKKVFVENIKQYLANGSVILVTVKDSGSTGKVYDGDVDHWVVITGISDFNYYEDELVKSDSVGGYDYYSSSNWVRIYNPFDNETEYYSYQDFREAWHKSGNNAILVNRKFTSMPRAGNTCIHSYPR